MTNDPRSGGTAQHASHDPILIAAFAADDVSPDERASAEAVVSACAECAAVAADLRAISAAVRSDLPVPRRRRDFRLADEDARRLRGGSSVGRALARLGAPGFAILQPLGGVAAAFGIALVVATSGLLPGGGPAALPAAGGAGAASADGHQVLASPGASVATAPGAPEETGGTTSFESPGEGAAPAGGGEDAPAEGVDTDARNQSEGAVAGRTVTQADAVSPGLLAGTLLLVVGLGAVVLRRLGMRLRRPG